MTSLLPTRSTVLLAAAALVLIATAAAAHEFTLGALTLDHPWARASAGPARNGAAFLAIDNAGAADRLLGAAGDIAERVELHTHEMAGDVMKMRRLEAVEIPAHGSAVMRPGGHHLMLIGLKRPLREGERFPLTLTFEKAGTITVEVAVEGVAGMGPHGDSDHGDSGQGANHDGGHHDGGGHHGTPSN